MKKSRIIILIVVCIITIFFFPLIWTIIGYFISLLSKFSWFTNIQNFVSTYSYIDKSQYIDFSSTLLCIISSSVLGFAAYKLSRKSSHNSNVKMALFVKMIFENSLKSIFNMYNHLPEQKIEIPDINCFEHEFTFLSDAEIEMFYKLYSKILKLSYMQNTISEDDTLLEEILNETLIDKNIFKYKEKYQKILDKSNQFFNK